MNSIVHGLILALTVACTAHADDARFSGNGSLGRSTQQASADQRFALTASLAPSTSPTPANTGLRFQLHASLSSTVASTACGPTTDEVFRNGFE